MSRYQAVASGQLRREVNQLRNPTFSQSSYTLHTTPHHHRSDMSAIGPDLPPHLLAKRKRTQEEQTEEAASTPSGAKHPPSPSNSEKKRRTIGPAMPPAPLNERPSEPVKPTEQHSDSEDEEFGPTLPKDTQEVQYRGQLSAHRL